ncbi:MAG TPA: alpha/beta hydrolase [Microlunatus sp.]
MRLLPRKLLLGAAVALCVPTLIATTAVPATAGGYSAPKPKPEPESYDPGPISWGECEDPILFEFGAECGSVTVPLDYTKPEGTKIRLAVSRVKHTVPDDEYQGVMLVNPGGPGGSGLIFSFLSFFVPKEAGLAYDWIGFDPRGVGASEPAVSCDPEYAGYNRPKYVPTSKKVERAWFKRTRAYTRDCDRENGRILEHLTTEDSARDMESLRRALDEPAINYYGFSYGTYLGSVYASLFPKRLRRVIFDGTVDFRDVWYKANLNQDPAFDRNMNIWFGWLARYNSVYRLGSTEAAVRRLFYATQSRLYRNPAQGQFGLLGGSEWNDAFLSAGYTQGSWTDLGAVFSAYVRGGDAGPFESAYLDFSGYGDDNGYAVYLGVQCTDTRWPQSWAKWKRDNNRIYRKAPYLTWGNAWYNEPCRHWPAPARTPVTIKDKGVDSILMINETLDAATPYGGSLAVRRRFENARLIGLPGGTTHSGSLGGNPCVDNRIADYLLTGALPARKPGNRADVRCSPPPQPEPTLSARQRKAKTSDKALLREELQKRLIRP